MRTLLFLSVSLLYSLSSIAQGSCNVIFFAEQGERFFVKLNGVQQNDQAQSNLKIEGLPLAQAYKLKVVFEDNSLPNVDKTIYLEENMETTINIKQNKKGVYVSRFFGSVAIKDANPSPKDQYVMTYGNSGQHNVTEKTVVTTTTTTTGNHGNGTSDNIDNNFVGEHEEVNVSTNLNGLGSNVSVHDHTSTNADGSVNENVDINMNVGGIDVNLDVNVTENGMSTNTDMNAGGTDIYNDNTNIDYNNGGHNGTSQSTTTVTTTTTTTNSNHNNGNNLAMGGNGITGSGCYPISAIEYQEAKSSIEAKKFSDSKLAVAKQITEAKCLDAKKIKGIVQLFDHEGERLEYAKFAYPHCSNPQDYYLINDAFTFESSIEELQKAIR